MEVVCIVSLDVIFGEAKGSMLQDTGCSPCMGLRDVLRGSDVFLCFL